MPSDPLARSRNLFDLTGRVAVITGGAAGLGRQMAEGLAEMGANLVLCGRKKERCESAAAELQALGVTALGMGCDVTNHDNVQQVVDAAVSRFGRIDILINTGVSASPWLTALSQRLARIWRNRSQSLVMTNPAPPWY